MIVGFIRTLLIIITFYYLFKLIARYVLPFLVKKGVENMQKKQQEEFNRYREEAEKREGEVIIQTKGNRKNQTQEKDTEGEYVDFEEVE